MSYFGEASQACGNCDVCINPPTLWDGTEAAQKLLSTVYRTGQRFGAGHVLDVLLGKKTEKVEKFGHADLSVFGIGAAHTDKVWRAVLRQLVVRGLMEVDHTAYGALITSHTPVSYWRLDEGNGTIAIDETATNPGQYQGTPTHQQTGAE